MNHRFAPERRKFLTRAGLATAAAVGGATALASCTSTPSNPGPGGDSNGPIDDLLPAYQPITSIVPDLHDDNPDVPDGFFSYPADPQPVNAESPGFGGEITAFAEAVGPVPPAAAQNPFWQELNTRLGVELSMDMVPVADWATRLQAMVAGDDLPEISQIRPIANLPGILGGRFEPLTSHLAGDAILEFPNLAAIPTPAWRGTVYNNELFGLPLAQPTPSQAMFARRDILESHGMSSELATGDDLLELCREVTDQRNNRWALGQVTQVVETVARMKGSGNTWEVADDGTFVNQWETDAYREALELTAQLFAEGLIHPDAASAAVADAKQWLGTGNIVMMRDGVGAWPGFMASYGGSTNPDFQLSLIVPPLWDGGGPAPAAEGRRWYCFGALRKGLDEERVKQILTVVNWLAAPFGSEEHRFLEYGIEGRHHRLDGSDPIVEGATGERVPVTRIGGRPAPFIYIPGDRAGVEEVFGFHQQSAQNSVPLPTEGLMSEANDRLAGSINREISDVITSVVVGNADLADFDRGLLRWQEGGGSQIAEEYAEAYREANR